MAHTCAVARQGAARTCSRTSAFTAGAAVAPPPPLAGSGATSPTFATVAAVGLHCLTIHTWVMWLAMAMAMVV